MHLHGRKPEVFLATGLLALPAAMRSTDSGPGQSSGSESESTSPVQRVSQSVSATTYTAPGISATVSSHLRALEVDDWIPVAQRVARKLGMTCPVTGDASVQPWRADTVTPVAAVCLRLTPLVRRLAVRAVHESAKRPKPGVLDMAKTAWAWASGSEHVPSAGEQALTRLVGGDPPNPRVHIRHTVDRADGEKGSAIYGVVVGVLVAVGIGTAVVAALPVGRAAVANGLDKVREAGSRTLTWVSACVGHWQSDGNQHSMHG